MYLNGIGRHFRFQGNNFISKLTDRKQLNVFHNQLYYTQMNLDLFAVATHTVYQIGRTADYVGSFPFTKIWKT